MADIKDETSEVNLQDRAEQKYAPLKRAVEVAGFFASQVIGDSDGDQITCTSKYTEGYGYTDRSIFVTEAQGRWYFATPHPYHYTVLDSSRIEQAVVAFLGSGNDGHEEIVQISANEYEEALSRRESSTRLSVGYTHLVGLAQMNHEAFTQAILETPADDVPRLVFADWLQEHGDEARADFIRVQIELARDGETASLKKREQALLAAHREEWEYPFRQFEVAHSFRRFVYGVQFHRGFVWALSLNDEDQRFVDNAAALFRLAPIERVNLFHKAQHEDLTRCPELLKVKELLIDRAGFEAESIAALLLSKHLTKLNRLDLIADDDNGHLDAEGLELLGKAKTLPALRHLDLSYNFCGWMFSDERRDWLTHLTKGRLIGQLETLRLRSTDVTDECAIRLARCNRAGSLRHLDLSGNSIGEAGLQALAVSKSLSSLITLDLRGNAYDDEGCGRLTECPPGTKRLLEGRFGSGLLLEGKAAPHPLDELFKQFE